MTDRSSTSEVSLHSLQLAPTRVSFPPEIAYCLYDFGKRGLWSLLFCEHRESFEPPLSPQGRRFQSNLAVTPTPEFLVVISLLNGTECSSQGPILQPQRCGASHRTERSLTGELTVLDDSKGAMQQTLGYDQVRVPRSLTLGIMQSWGHLGD